MIGVNRFTGIGNMTGDPTLKQGEREDGSSDRCEFAIAINKPQGRSEHEPEPTYLDLVAWGKLAQQVDQYGRKGRLVYVEGEIEVRKWEDKDTGDRRKAFRIKAYVVRFLDPAKRDDDDDRPRRREGRDESRRREEPQRRIREEQPRRRDSGYKAEDFDDLPF
jgi:single-strand DNA-binding protein